MDRTDRAWREYYKGHHAECWEDVVRKRARECTTVTGGVTLTEDAVADRAVAQCTVVPCVVTVSAPASDGGLAPEHVGEQPSWECRACGQPWPCAPARATLAHGADRVMLAIYMWGQLDRATADLSPRAPAELFERFLSWTDGELVQA